MHSIKHQKMESSFLWLNLSIFIISWILLFGLLRKVNEWYYVSKLGKKKHSLPPGDMGWPLLGNTLSSIGAFKSNEPNKFINNFVKRYGRTGIYKTHLFGSPGIIVCTPETCRQVLMDDEKFGYGYPASTIRLTKRSFLSRSNSEHKRLRKLITSPIKGHEALAMHIGYIEEIVIASLEEWASMDRPIEFFYKIRKVTFKVITHIFLGSCSDSILESMEKYLVHLFEGLASVAINIPGFSFHRAFKARNKLVQILQEIIDDKRTMNKCDRQEMKKGTIDLMMAVEDENSQNLEDEEIIDLLLTFLLGNESSALIVMWAIIYLQQHPEMLHKAKEEQEEIIKKRPSTQKGLSFKEIKLMDYLAKVTNETLRLITKPISNFREAKTDVIIEDYIIPKGWKIWISNQSIHMDPENYLIPKEFDPSRWDNHVAKPGSFIPFGAGSKICPGGDLAKIEVYIFLHHFLLKYKLEQLHPKFPTVYITMPRPSDNYLAKVVKLK